MGRAWKGSGVEAKILHLILACRHLAVTRKAAEPSVRRLGGWAAAEEIRISGKGELWKVRLWETGFQRGGGQVEPEL